MVAAWSESLEAGGLGSDHEQTLLARRHLANALKMFGGVRRVAASGPADVPGLARDPAFGDDHEHTVAVAYGLGFDLRMAGDGDLVASWSTTGRTWQGRPGLRPRCR